MKRGQVPVVNWLVAQGAPIYPHLLEAISSGHGDIVAGLSPKLEAEDRWAAIEIAIGDGRTWMAQLLKQKVRRGEYASFVVALRKGIGRAHSTGSTSAVAWAAKEVNLYEKAQVVEAPRSWPSQV